MTWLPLDTVADLLAVNPGHLRRRCAQELLAAGQARKARHGAARSRWEISPAFLQQQLAQLVQRAARLQAALTTTQGDK